MGSFPNRALRVGDWRVDPALDQISRDGQVVRLEPRTMRLLLHLTEHAQEVVSAEELLEQVWRGVVVAPGSVYQAVARLRRTLGDVSEAPTYIETIPRKGYRLIAPVSPWAPADTAATAHTDAPAQPGPARSAFVRRAGWAAAAALVLAAGLAFWLGSPESLRRLWTGRAPPRSVAVLPFVALGGAPDDQYLGYGLSEDLINSLANVAGLHVAARTSSFLFAGRGGDLQQIREKLNVDTVLEGSIRRHAGRVRIVAELIDARSGYHLWSQAFERDDQQMWAVHDEIADAVLEHMDPAMTRPVSHADALANNGPAYNEFLRGRFLLEQRTEEGLTQAVSHFQRAIALAPDDALAYSGLADAYALLSQYAAHDDPTLLSQARAAAQHALSLSPDLAEAHASLGLIDNQAGHLQEAIPHLRRAIVLDPHYGPAQMWYGRNLYLQHDFVGADRVFEHALIVDPLSGMLQLNAGLALDQLDRLPEATEHARRAIALEPGLPSAYWLLAFLNVRIGHLSEGVQLFRSATALGLNQAEALGQMSALHAQLGDCDAAEHWLQAGRQRDPLNWAVLYGGVSYYLCRRDLKGLVTSLEVLQRRGASDAQTRAAVALGFALADARARALEAYRLVEAAPDGDATLFDRSGLGIGVSHALEYAVLLRAAGQRDKAATLSDGVHARLETIHQQGGRAAGLEYCTAGVLAAQGQTQAALTALERAVADGWRAPEWMERDPALGTLRSSPKFAGLLAEQRRDVAEQRSRLLAQPNAK
jgi:TolB-like protein/DNA-binding winged helix-turn-helix (wHTH) protein/Tfp pilus assembly protein PilF